MKDKITSLLTISLLIGYFSVPNQILEESLEEEVEIPEIIEIKHDVLATYYNPVEEQCDSDPLTTADNSRIDLNKLKAKKIKWIAVSRYLLDFYNMGDTIEVNSENPELSGLWVIRDKMNKRFTNRIDFLCHIDYVPMNKPEFVTIKKK